MSFKVSRAETVLTSVKDVLFVLDSAERKEFLRTLHKIRENTSNNERQKVMVLLSDLVHDEHLNEVTNSAAVIANKLSHEPLLGDRYLLKSTLEAIMTAVNMAEREV